MSTKKAIISMVTLEASKALVKDLAGDAINAIQQTVAPEFFFICSALAIGVAMLPPKTRKTVALILILTAMMAATTSRPAW